MKHNMIIVDEEYLNFLAELNDIMLALQLVFSNLSDGGKGGRL